MDKEEIKQIAYDYTTCKADAKKLEDRILSLFSVSQQRELLIEAFDLINIHDGDRKKITKLVDITLKSINCG